MEEFEEIDFWEEDPNSLAFSAMSAMVRRPLASVFKSVFFAILRAELSVLRGFMVVGLL